MLDTEVKVFHESISYFMKLPWNCISWNALKENFTVYPSLKTPFTFWDMHMGDIWNVGSQTFRICEKLANFTCKVQISQKILGSRMNLYEHIHKGRFSNLH